MKTIESILNPLTGYLISITRNTINGWYELEIGIPANWVFDENEIIECEVLKESEAGKLIKVKPKNLNVVLDDLISFVDVIIETNKRIADKEKQFNDKMEKMKIQLEEEAKKFYKELDELKENSFKSLNDSFIENFQPDKKESKVRKSNKPITYSGTTS